MSDLIGKNGELLLSPGELWDRFTILEIKALWINDYEKQEQAAREWCRVSELIQNMHAAGFVPKTRQKENWRMLLHLLDDLRKQNRTQWECEDKVRKEESWEAAKAARDSNTERVNIKNAINELYGYAIDVKEYAGETDE